jgi:proteic killer suppression protein
MIKTFTHKGLEDLFRHGKRAGVQIAHVSKLQRILAQLDWAAAPEDMNLPGWRLHQLKGNLAGHWSVTVNANWRVTFKFDGTDAIVVDYVDYH